MSYFHTCQNCGSTLDPGESCVCDKERRPSGATDEASQGIVPDVQAKYTPSGAENQARLNQEETRAFIREMAELTRQIAEKRGITDREAAELVIARLWQKGEPV